VPEDLSVSHPISSVIRFSSSPLYPSIISNIPGKMMEGYVDPIEQVQPEIAPFVTQGKLIEHVKETVEKHLGEIFLNSLVEKIVKTQDGKYDLFIRQVIDKTNEKWSQETFDGVVIATGRSNVPRIPPIKGLDGWKGVLVHSVSYRRPEEFAGKVCYSSFVRFMSSRSGGLARVVVITNEFSAQCNFALLRQAASKDSILSKASRGLL